MVDSSSFWSEKLKNIEERNKSEDPKYKKWKKGVLEKWNPGSEEKEFTNSSGIPIKELYVPGDLDGDINERLGYPGTFPFSRLNAMTSTSSFIAVSTTSSGVGKRPA